MIETGLYIQEGVVIPEHEFEITASRAGGPGGQHVNKTSTRISIRWNVKNTIALHDIQKERVLNKLHHQLTSDGDLIVHSSASRSQQQNKKLALAQLANTIRKALHVPKKRIATKVSKAIQEKRLKSKTHRSDIKKMRRKKFDE